MPDSNTNIQRYLDQPLDDLLEELALYREQATGGPVRDVSDAALEKYQQAIPANLPTIECLITHVREKMGG